MRRLIPFIFLTAAVACRRDEGIMEVSQARLEHLWEVPAPATADDLFAASLTAFRLKDIERGVFFLWCAQVRLRFERQMFPPVETGGNSPTLPLYAMGQMAGQTFIPLFYASPDMHLRVVAKFGDYVPECSRSFRPPWKYGAGVGQTAAVSGARSAVAQVVKHSQAMLQLTAIPEYLESLKVYADFKDQSPERPARFRAANEIMRRIEADTKIESGLVFKTKQPNPVPDRTTPVTSPAEQEPRRS